MMLILSILCIVGGGSGSGHGDPSPWGENNVRHLEDAPKDLE